MSEPTPYVVENKWIVYAKNSMEALAKYRIEFGLTKSPIVRQAKIEEVIRLTPFVAAVYRRAA